MFVYHPNWDLLDLKSDLFVLESHLGFVEEQMQFQRDKHEFELRNRLKTRAYDRNDEMEQAMEWGDIQDHREWVSDGLPRLVLNPFIVAVWALYESVIVDLSAIVQKKQDAPLSLADIGGKHLVDRVDKYFRHVLHFPIDYTKERRDTLNFLGALRNAIAHGNGKLVHLSKQYQRQIRDDVMPGVSVSGDGVYIVLETEFARSAFAAVKAHLTLLFERYETLSGT